MELQLLRIDSLLASFYSCRVSDLPPLTGGSIY
nr:MAG TPA: hypothetical protein [Crassvirales sp.]